MRKTKLIILPTKCLNQMGFLLLFLSCPVIGDWGRIRPDSEMSQWSIQIEREGSCGLVRNPPGGKDELMRNGLSECNAADLKLGNNTEMEQVGELDSAFTPFWGIRESRLQRGSFRTVRSLTDSERRVDTARRELKVRSSRRSFAERQYRQERRAVSLDRQRHDESARRTDRITSRRVEGERESRTYRRLSQSLERRVEGRRASPERRVRADSGRVMNDARRASPERRVRANGERVMTDARRGVSRIRREVNERNQETLRRIENVQSRRVTDFDRAERFERKNERRVEEDRRVRNAARDGRRDSDRQRMARRVAESPERRNVDEERMARRVRTESRDSSERRANARREDRRASSLDREVHSRRRYTVEERRLIRDARRSVDRAEARRASPARRTERDGERRSTNERRMRMEDVRATRRDERTVREASERRALNERSVRSLTRSERSVESARTDERRIEARDVSQARRNNDQFRRQDLRMSVRSDKPEERAVRREVDGILARLRDQRDKPIRTNERMRLEPLSMKQKKQDGVDDTQRWQFLDDIKTWFSQKHDESVWGGNLGDFTTTCLVGAAVYFLTTRQVKSI